MQGWSKGVIYSAVAMLGAGMLLIVLGWNGAASLDHVSGQIPYLISGGLGGVALAGAGLTLIVVHSLRRDLLSLGQKLDRVVDAVEELQGTAALGPTAVPDDEGVRVVAGRTTYHARSCHLVEGREDLQVMAPETARDRGLAPCRICNPHRSDRSA